MQIVFHGRNAATFAEGIEALLDGPHDIRLLPDRLRTAEEVAAYETAQVIVSSFYNAELPAPRALRLFHVPGAGTDAVDLKRLPSAAAVCNCFGHETAIGEYVMAALLRHVVPIDHADRELRRGEWAYWSARDGSLHGELAGRTIGLLGYGHIGRRIARLADAFDMRVLVANRRPVAAEPPVSASYTLDRLEEFCAAAEFIVCSLPHLPETEGLLGAAAFAAMRPDAVVVNVGRGPVIDQQALYDALAERRIGGAVIDTWYVYPPAGESSGTLPARLPFHELDNVVMTPHMSGWTDGMMARRRQTIAENIGRLARGAALANLVRAAG
ncbi:phosphoglycerate dehydrogenase [Aliidongia dinghuensis]|uniref:Phosphoglycerate dehydrogenase n=1 Tax=Aliidongia dinghuensis TaxID=1867774 RepID=A0A8J2YXZ5_9PROT|nr:2-hydroxyacid dehydrogenase [Aliidongia dinghuensis]GGF34409.1 phosphoglycerate dehydrogenase [Aliidongia dinghuensis]